MRYFLIAGEASGDLHAAALMRELKMVDAQAEFCFMGGDLMLEQGGKLVQHYKHTAFMGFSRVLMNFNKVLKSFDLCKKVLVEFNPDAVVLVDFPGFNLPMAKFVKQKLHKPVFYYIPPKIWAWKEGRIRQIKKYVDKVFTILPFEPEFYRKHDYEVEYTGNPTVEQIEKSKPGLPDFEEFIKQNNLTAKPVIALLPGSRRQEITACLPIMLQAASNFGDYQIIISGAPGIETSFYTPYVNETKIPVLFNQTHSLVKNSKIAVVNSGTATLETAILGTPQVVVYHVKFGKLALLVKKLFLKVKYISLVNLIAGHEVVKELVAADFTVQNLQTEMGKLIEKPENIQTMHEGFALLADKLGKMPSAETTARKIYSILKNEGGV
jgi:lipid-A-disaccharide synthase